MLTTLRFIGTLAMQASVLTWLLCLGISFAQNYDIPVYRLPTYIIPLHYTITLTPQLVPPFQVNGEVQIEIETTQEVTDEIVLHLGEELQLQEINISISDLTNNTIKLAAVENDIANQMVTIKTNTSLGKGAVYILKLPFTGSLGTDRKGLYVDSFKDTPDEYFLSSNLYPIYARLAFPCFDEPSFKAKFQVTIIIPERFTAVSNSPVNETVPFGTNQTAVTFATTPPIGTQFVSIFVGKISTSTLKVGSINITVIHRGVFSLPPSNSTFLSLISTVHNILPYSMDSIKVILLPNMERRNGGFGIMYFNEDFFNITALTITEELNRYKSFLEQLLKQYFNVAVTPVWWSDIWLSEGITMYLQYLVLDLVVTGLPDFYPAELLIDIRHKAMKLDISSKPLVDNTVLSPDDILTTLADDLKKYKGALVLKMLKLSLPPGVLLQTLNTYLSEKTGGTVSTADFLEILSATTNTTNTADTMTDLDSWFYAPGYPVVSVKRNPNNTVVLTQETFCEFDTPCRNSTVWKIPINYVTKDTALYKWKKTEPVLWLGEEPLEIKDVPDTTWIILNTQAQGYYSINYSNHDLTLIKEMLSDSVNFNDEIIYNKMSRGQIADDVMTLAAQGLVEYKTAFDIISCYKYETNYFILASVFNSLDFIESVLYGEEVYKKFQIYMATLMDEMKAPNSSYTYTLNDALTTQWRCATSNCTVYTQIAEQFIQGKYQWLETLSKIQFHEYLCAGVRFKNGTIYEQLIEAYKKSQNTPYREYIVTGMGCLTYKNDLHRLLQEIIQNTSINTEEVKSILNRILTITENIEDVLDFIVSESQVLAELFGEEILVETIAKIGEKLTKETHATKLVQITSSELPAVREQANMSLTNLRTRIKCYVSCKLMIVLYPFPYTHFYWISPKVLSEGVLAMEPPKGTKTFDGSASYEEAISLAGHGKFNYIVTVVGGLSMMTSLLASVDVSYILPASECELNLDKKDRGTLSGAFFVGIVVSSHLLGFLSDTLGRRYILVRALLTNIFVYIISSLSPNFWTLLIMRFITGIVLCGVLVCALVYVGEFHSNKHRSKAVMFLSSLACLAFIYCACLGWLILPSDWSLHIFGILSFTPWRLYYVILGGVPSIILGIAMLILPESPKYLLACSRKEEALQVLQRVYKCNTGNPKEEYPVKNLLQNPNELVSQLNGDSKTAGAVIRFIWNQTYPLFMPPHLLNMLCSCFILFSLFYSFSGLLIWIPDITNQLMILKDDVTAEPQKFCQIVQSNWTANIIRSSGFSTTVAQSAVCKNTFKPSVFILNSLIGIMLFLSLALGTFVLPKIPRKMLVSVVSFAIVVIYVVLLQFPNIYAMIICLGLVIILLNIIFFGTTILLVDYFPTNYRAMAVCLAIMSGRIGSAVGGDIFSLFLLGHCQEMFYIAGGLMFLGGVSCISLRSPKSKIVAVVA